MSYKSSQATALPNGTYAIWSSNHESVMAPKRLRNVDDRTFVVAEDAPPFRVLHSSLLLLLFTYEGQCSGMCNITKTVTPFESTTSRCIS